MTFRAKTASLTAALSLMAAPAFAFDGTDNPGSEFRPEGTPPSYSGTENPGAEHRVTREEARAIGRDECQEFKTNFAENKSQFGKCVAAVAKALRQDTNPRQACEGLNRKPQEGERPLQHEGPAEAEPSLERGAVFAYDPVGASSACS